VNLEVLNGYVLAGIAIFALCLYVAVVATGLAELTSGRRNFGTRRQRSRNHGASRRRRNANGSTIFYQ
jgi:hypothetical protein